MIEVIFYSNNKVKKGDITSLKSKKGKFWISCNGVTLKELGEIADATKIPLYELKHVADPQEKPRVSNRSNYSLFIFRGIFPGNEGKKVTFPIEFIITKNFFITLCAEKSETIGHLQKEIDSIIWKKTEKEGFGVLFYTLLLGLIKDYERYLEDVDDKVDALEDASLQALEKDLYSLLHLKRKLVFLRRSLATNKEALTEIEHGKLNFVESTELFLELDIEFNQVLGTMELIKDRMTSIMEIHLSAASNNLNQVMKSFTIIATIILLPTLISGIYGMNIILPYAQRTDAFLIVIGIMVVSVALMLWFFRAKGWL